MLASLLAASLCACLATCRPLAREAQPGGASSSSGPGSQQRFAVNASALGLPFAPPSSLAGTIPTGTRGHDANALFFWAFERQPGSLAAKDGPWMIWLNGGPGASSMLGLLLENGPIHMANNNSFFENEWTWQRLTDIVYVDQPVGVGYSPVADGGQATTEEEVGEDFVGFLRNLVKVFPALQSRPLYLAGESYAGTYIPYIARAILGAQNSPVKLAKLVMGDPTIGSRAEYRDLPTTTIIKTFPQLIGYDTSVFEFYRAQENLCGYNLTLQYPSPEPYPTLQTVQPDFPGRGATLGFAKRSTTTSRLRSLTRALRSGAAMHDVRRDSSPFLAGRPSNVIDPWYGCFILDSLLDFAVNFTFPWTLGDIDIYDIPDGGESLPIPSLLPAFLNEDSVKQAIHVPADTTWAPFVADPFGPVNGQDDKSPPTVTFLGDLASQVPLLLYSGNDDADVSHRGTELAIQNMTFGGIRGFTQKPSTPWFDDTGSMAGIVHQERGVQYILVLDAGHQVPLFNPPRAFSLLRNFVLGTNANGTVTGDKPVGGQRAALQKGYVRAPDAIFYPAGSSTSSTVWPSATIAAWDKFINRIDQPTDGAHVG